LRLARWVWPGLAKAARSFVGGLRGYVTRVVLVVVDGASLQSTAYAAPVRLLRLRSALTAGIGGGASSF
jgi:hypothetical protein